MTDKTPEIYSLKEQIAENYIKDFTKELNFLQKAGVFFVESRIKSLMLQEDELPQSLNKIQLTPFEEKLASFAPETANKVFEFLKEKQKLLLDSDTKEKLEQLKEGIVPSKNDQSNKEDETKNITQQAPMDVPSIAKKATEESGHHEKQHIVSGHSTATRYGIIWAGVVTEGVQSVIDDGSKIGSKTFVEWLNFKKWERLADALNEWEVKKWLNQISDMLKARLANPSLLPKQKKVIENTLKSMEEGLDNASTIEDIKVWKKLVKEWKISESLFGHLNQETITKLAKEMSLFKNDVTLLKELTTLSKTWDKVAIKTFLESNGVKNISDDIIHSLMMTNWDEKVLESTINLLSKWDKISKLGKAVKAIPVLDLVFYGIEVYDYATNEEASKLANIARRENAENRETMHLAVDTLTSWIPAVYATGAALSLYTWLAASGPVGWVLLGGVALGEGVKYGADKLFFDVQDFYKQNKSDFASQSLTQVKQAMLQANYSALWKNLALNDTVGWVGNTQTMNTLKDAFWGAIYLEEQEKYPLVAKQLQLQAIKPTVNSLSPEQQEVYYKEKQSLDAQKTVLINQRKKLEAIVSQRMKYILPYCAWGAKAQEFQKAINTANGMQYIDLLLAKSKTYEEMLLDTTKKYSDLDLYIAEKNNILKNKNSVLYMQLKELQRKQPWQYAEFVKQVLIYKNTVTHDTEYWEFTSVIDFVEEFDHTYNLGKSTANTYDIKHIASTDYVLVEKTLNALKEGKNIALIWHVLSDKDIKVRFTKWWSNTQWDSLRFAENQEYSNSVGQNILYRLAKQFHWYKGENNMAALQVFYASSEDGKKDNALGIYFDAEDQVWKMNNDYTKDHVINLHDLEKKSAAEIMNDWCKEMPLFTAATLVWVTSFVPGSIFLADKILPTNTLLKNKDMIDTPTESVDDQLNQEFLITLNNIVAEEKNLLSVDNQKKVQQEIVTYIKTQWEVWYLQLPYDLIHKASRAGLWQLQYFYFSIWTDGKLIIVSRHEYVWKSLNIPGVVKQYIDENNPELKKWFDEIDWSKIPLITLWNNTNEWKVLNQTLNITKEIQKTAWEITRKGRWDVLYDPLKKTITSRWKEIKLDTKNGKRIIADGKINVEYTSLREAIMIANIVNWFGGKYKKEHPKMELQYGSMWMWGAWWSSPLRQWVFDVNTWFWWYDTKLISWSTIKNKLTQTFSTEANSKSFIKYLAQLK